MLIIKEENKELKGTIHKLPNDFYKLFLSIVKNYPQFVNDPGYKRAKNVIENWPYVTMEWLKNMKHFFSVNEPNSDSYKLAGGDNVKYWVDDKLNVLISNTTKKDKVKNPSKVRTETSSLAGMHGDHNSSSLSISNSIMSGLIPKFESINKNYKIFIISEKQFSELNKIIK